MELAIWASFILQFRVRNRAGGGEDFRGGDIATENARLGATGPIDLLDTESAIAVRDDLAAPNAQLLDVGGPHLGKAAQVAAVGGHICLIGALEGFEVTAPLMPLLLKDVTSWYRHGASSRFGRPCSRC
jgi:NADPH:quinone reductase-like Zn-dependent oxidoreductase